MKRFDLLRSLPTHVARALGLQLEAASGCEAGASLLYAAHRGLCLAIAARDGWDAPAARLPRLADLAKAFAPDGGGALDDLVAAADLFLASAVAKPEDAGALAPDLETAALAAISAIGPALLAAAAPDRPDAVFAFVGPSGVVADRFAHGCDAASTLVATGDAWKRVAAAAAGTPPLPLVPCPGPEGSAWSEAADGSVIDNRGRALPFAALTPGRALGRIVAWHRGLDADIGSLAGELAGAGFAEAGGEALAILLATGADMPEPAAVEAAREYYSGHGLAAQGAAVDAWLLSRFDEEEARNRDAGDFKGVSTALLGRQQVQSGADKALTLSRLANLFRERLSDPEGAFWCVVSALEETPGDEALLHEVAEEATSLGKEAEAAPRLLDLARSASGAARAKLGVAASRMFEAAKDPAAARTALAVALEGAPADPGLLALASAAAEAAGDHEGLLVLLARRRDAATDAQARLPACLAGARLLEGTLHRPADAIEWYRLAMVVDPSGREAIDHVVDLLLGQGRAADAATEVDRALARAFEPGLRALLLRRKASLAIAAGDDQSATDALASALALDPEDRPTLESLEALFEKTGAWVRLLGLLRRRVHDEPASATERLNRMADIAADRLGDPEAALGFLSEAARLAPDDAALAARISGLHESLGLWADVARDLEAEAGREGTTDRAGVLARLAGICLERLGQRERAKATLRRALDAATGATAVEIGKRLAALHREDSERGAELAALEVAAKALGGDEAADLYATMGKRCLEDQVDRDAAKGFLEAAVRLHPAHPVAVEALAGLLLSIGQPERVLALVEPLAAAARQDGDEVAERRLRLLAAGSAVSVGDQAGAIAQYARAAELDPGDVRTRVVLGRLHAKAGRDTEAAALLSRVIEEAGDGLTPMDRDEVETTAARCAARMGDHGRALALLTNVLERRGKGDPDLMREIVAEAEAAGDKARLAAAIEKWIWYETDPSQRFALTLRLGDLCKDALGDAVAALKWYQAARQENPSSKAAAHKALEAAVAAGSLGDAKGLLVAVMELEQDGLKRAQYHYASAVLVRDHFGDRDLMREHLQKAIELNPDHEEAVAALESLLQEGDDHEAMAGLHQLLARHYRLTGQDDRMIGALNRLAANYDEKLHNLPLAAETLRQVLQTSPRDAEAAARLADVLTRTPGKDRDALEAHRAAVALDPTHAPSYRAIRDLCILTGDEDGAWCAAATLCALGQATDADKAAFEANRQAALKLKRDLLPRETFVRCVLDEAADDGVARVLDLVYEPLRPLLPWKQPKDLGLTEADRVDMNERGMFQNMAMAASKVLAIPLPRVYLARGRSGIAKVAFDPPAIAVGEDVLTAWRGKDLRFGMGRALVSFAPGFKLAGVSDATSLRLFFLAALRIAFPDHPLPDDAAGVEGLAQELFSRLAPEARTELTTILTDFRRQKKGIDLHGFLAGVDRTANRAGLFLANDLVVAANQLQEDTLFLSDLEFGDRLTDLCAWSVSARYAELRRLMLQV
jgi:tetratricopeptide (TPR) repeat protein